MQFSIRASYPENNEYIWTEAVQQYVDVGRVEVSFFSTELFLRNVQIEDVIEPFQKLPIEASSIHMAHVNITDFPLFELVLDKTAQIAKVLKCKHIVVHPSKANLEEVKDFITAQERPGACSGDEGASNSSRNKILRSFTVEYFIEHVVDKILSREKVYLCWETFTSKKRFLSGINGIAEFCHGKEWHKACYDFSHVHDDRKTVIRQISKYLNIIKIFHISNRISNQKIQHLPVFHKGAGELDLDFMPILKFLKEKAYDGTLVLEYLPEFQFQLAEDAKFLKNKFE